MSEAAEASFVVEPCKFEPILTESDCESGNGDSTQLATGWEVFAVANAKSHAMRYQLPCLVSQKMRIFVLYVQIQLSSRQVSISISKMKAPLMMNH